MATATTNRNTAEAATERIRDLNEQILDAAKKAGGAYLQDVNGDNVLDWVPVHDPRVFQEGRAVDGGGIGAGAEARQHDPLLGKLSFHYHLGGDTGMVGAGLPQHVATAHALIADENILQGEGQGMAHVQAARHIGWRHHDGEGLGRR